MAPVQLKKPMEIYFLQSQQQLISEEIQKMLKKVAQNDTNDTKTEQQPRIPQQFVFIKEIGWRKPPCVQLS